MSPNFLETPSLTYIMEENPTLDPRSNSTAFGTAKNNEIQEITDRKVWEVANISSVPPKSDNIGGRF